MSNAGGGEADKEMHSIAKEELADCTAALDELRLDLTSLLLPRCATTTTTTITTATAIYPAISFPGCYLYS